MSNNYLCNHKDCLNGMGLVGLERCDFGDPYNPQCPGFINEEEALKEHEREHNEREKAKSYTINRVPDIIIDDVLKEPIDGLLYDLDLLPEQISNDIDCVRMQIIERMKKIIDENNLLDK